MSRPHEILGVHAQATLSEIKVSYLELAKIFHPDAGGDTRCFVRVAAAYAYMTGKGNFRLGWTDPHPELAAKWDPKPLTPKMDHTRDAGVYIGGTRVGQVTGYRIGEQVYPFSSPADLIRQIEEELKGFGASFARAMQDSADELKRATKNAEKWAEENKLKVDATRIRFQKETTFGTTPGRPTERERVAAEAAGSRSAKKVKLPEGAGRHAAPMARRGQAPMWGVSKNGNHWFLSPTGPVTVFKNAQGWQWVQTFARKGDKRPSKFHGPFRSQILAQVDAELNWED